MRPKIYLFGDSITEASFAEGGWGSSLANHFSRTADVVLRGYSGYNTRWALKVKEKVLHPSESSRSPAAVLVFFGANDACIPDRSSAFQYVPLEEYKQNLHAIVAFLKKQWPSSCVLLITPPPIDEAARLLHPLSDNSSGLPERTNEAAGNYSKACLAVASECGVAAVDLWTKMQQFPGWQKAYLVYMCFFFCSKSFHRNRVNPGTKWGDRLTLLLDHSLRAVAYNQNHNIM
ncbi:GDSL esterase/lipase At5g45920-like [Primulina eburnea]|uniref:GDSL esterase/lipase At5g45920-like n=1 Tax=Primulina eburnea TaxID=1245227 RepID=UPI003C6C8CEC